PFPAVPTGRRLQIATAREIAPTWNARNRIAMFQDKPDLGQYRNYAQKSSLWAITASLPSELPNPIPHDHEAYAVVYDERYTSDDPRFCPAELTFAPGVLPSRFRPLEEVDIVGADRLLAAADRFLKAS